MKKVREIHFFRAGSEVALDGIFDSLYEGVKELAKFNLDHNSTTGIIGRRQSFSAEDAFEKLRVAASKNLTQERENPTFSGYIVFDDNIKSNFLVNPRTNYHPTLTKLPNIAYLVTEDKVPIILREARVYAPDVEERVNKIGKYVFREHFKGQLVEPSNIHQNQPKDKSVCYIPEPHLVLALEQLALEGKTQRLLPEIRTLGVSQSRLWYIRDFLLSAQQSSVHPGSFVEYFGQLHGLGLIDDLDFDMEHYCISGQRVINIDPDFMYHTNCQGILEHKAWGNVHDEHNWRWNTSISKGFLKTPEVRKKRHQLIEQAHTKMQGKTIREYLRSNPSDYPVLGSLAIQ